MQAVTRVNAEQASKTSMRRPTRRSHGEGCQRPVPPSGARTKMAGRLRRGTGDSMHAQGSGCNTGSPVGGAHAPTENPRGPVWAGRVADKPAVPGKRGNACGGKEPRFERRKEGDRDRGDRREPTSPDYGSEIPDGATCVMLSAELCGVGRRSPSLATLSADLTPHNLSARGLGPSAGIDLIPPCCDRSVLRPDGAPCFVVDRSGAANPPPARPPIDLSLPPVHGCRGAWHLRLPGERRGLCSPCWHPAQVARRKAFRDCRQRLIPIPEISGVEALSA